MKKPVVNDKKEFFMLNIPAYCENKMEDLRKTFIKKKKREKEKRKKEKFKEFLI